MDKGEKNTDKILQVLEENEESLSTREIEERTGLLPGQVKTALYWLKRQGKVMPSRQLKFARYDRWRDDRQLWQWVAPPGWTKAAAEDGYYWFTADGFKTVEVVELVTGWNVRSARRMNRMGLEYPGDCEGCWWYGPLAPPEWSNEDRS